MPGSRFGFLVGVQYLPQLGVLPHAIAVAANRHEMAVVHGSITGRGRHDIIAEDVAPFLEALLDVRTVDACS
jgi:hypothetical protein